VFDDQSVLVQCHIFLVLALVAALLVNLILRPFLKKKKLFGPDPHVEWLAVLLLVIAYVFATLRG